MKLCDSEQYSNLAVEERVQLALELGDDLEEVLTLQRLHSIDIFLELIAQQTQH